MSEAAHDTPYRGAWVDGVHHFALRVYFEDTDTAGIVYYANYLRFMERARSDMLRALGIDASGPVAADAMFHARARSEYDVAMCPYHDQALIPIKTLHFDEGVNMTLGLPIVRTSPDHGTAFDIAGQDRAEPGAMIAAIRMAAAAATMRIQKT